MAEKKKMSVDDILAACRKPGTGEAAPAAKKTPPAAEASEPAAPPEPAAPAAEKPVSPKPAAKPGAMNVADILAAARAGKASGAPAAEPKKEAPAEPKPKPAAAAKPKAAEDKPVPAKAATPIDTASILAAARGKADKQPGPMSKAEAAAKGKPEVEGKKKIAVPPMPPKPAYAAPKAAVATKDTRRGFVASLGAITAGSAFALGFSSLAVTNLLWTLGLARFMFPNILIEPPTKFKVGFPDALAPGQVDERYKAQFGVWIVKYEYEGQAEIYALKTVCTHLGCTPSWLEAEQKFKCPCHGSGFYKDGINFEGPAPRPLERYAIRIADDGQLEVDKSRVFHEETGQWNDTSCYVPT